MWARPPKYLSTKEKKYNNLASLQQAYCTNDIGPNTVAVNISVIICNILWAIMPESSSLFTI